MTEFQRCYQQSITRHNKRVKMTIAFSQWLLVFFLIICKNNKYVSSNKLSVSYLINKVISLVREQFDLVNVFNPFQCSVVFYTGTSHLFYITNQMAAFYVVQWLALSELAVPYQHSQIRYSNKLHARCSNYY